MKIEDNDNFLSEFLSRHGDVEAKPSFEPDTEIDGWRITGFLGRGGSSEVYCAKSVQTGSAVALKVLHRTELRQQERFAREVAFLETNTNPSFPRVFGKGRVNGRLYYALELLEPLPLPKGDKAVARYLCAIASGLEGLHVSGYVHRDVKPRNIMARGNGEPVLIDLGLIKGISGVPIQADDQLSVVDGREVGVGTPRYAAPEQFSGGDATPAMDIHALGRLAYECFGGKPPRAWSRIIRRATSSIPGERFQSAGEFIRAVRRRHLVRMALLATLFLAGVAGGVALWMQPRVPNDAAEDVTVTARDMVVASRDVSGMDGDNGSKKQVGRAPRARRDDLNEAPLPSPVTTNVVSLQMYNPPLTNTVEATIIELNGGTNVFTHPLVLDPKREYWIIGPGVLDASFKDSRGATMRLSNCTFLNRTEKPLKDVGVRYILYKGAVLDFTKVSRDIDAELAFISMSYVPLPRDDTARSKGAIVYGDRSNAVIRYMKTDREREHERIVEQAILRARQRSEEPRRMW